MDAKRREKIRPKIAKWTRKGVKFTGILRSAILQGEKLSRGGHKTGGMQTASGGLFKSLRNEGKERNWEVVGGSTAGRRWLGPGPPPGIWQSWLIMSTGVSVMD